MTSRAAGSRAAAAQSDEGCRTRIRRQERSSRLFSEGSYSSRACQSLSSQLVPGLCPPAVTAARVSPAGLSPAAVTAAGVSPGRWPGLCPPAITVASLSCWPLSCRCHCSWGLPWTVAWPLSCRCHCSRGLSRYSLQSCLYPTAQVRMPRLWFI